MTLPGKIPTDFRSDEEGGMTIFGLYIFATMAIISGIAIDVSNLIAARSQLQIVADAAAHAALYNRDTMDADEAKNAALTIVADMMPAAKFGDVLTANDIVFGHWDYASSEFEVDPDGTESVMVRASRLAENDNSVAALLTQFIGRSEWNVAVNAVYTTYSPTCFREGFVAEGVVDIQSNNGFSNGFCIHSNSYVSMNNNNFFEPGTIVSMPDSSLIDLPNSGWEKNEGLAAALREGAYRLRIVNKLPQIIDNLRNNMVDVRPDYITYTGINYVNNKTITLADLRPNAVNVVSCGNAGKLSIKGAAISEVVIVTTCEVSLANNLVVHDAIIATTNTSAKSINSPSGLVVGQDDGCADGGGAQLLTLGGMNFAADLHVFGSQLIAVGDIEFAANANGVEGASMIAGGTLSGTSNMTMGFCGSGMEDNFEASYFRLAY